MIETESHYDVLGITADASQDKIHRAYTALLKQLQSQPDSSELRLYLSRAKLAYQVLSHPGSRAAYHQQMAMAGPPQRRWETPKEDKMHPAMYMGCFTLVLGLPGLLISGLYAWITRRSREDN